MDKQTRKSLIIFLAGFVSIICINVPAKAELYELPYIIHGYGEGVLDHLSAATAHVDLEANLATYFNDYENVLGGKASYTGPETFVQNQHPNRSWHTWFSQPVKCEWDIPISGLLQEEEPIEVPPMSQ